VCGGDLPFAVTGVIVIPLLKDQIAIVTGAGRGIGAATAKLFAEEGAHVVVCDLDAAPAQQVVAAIEAAGGRAIAFPGDVTDPSFPDQLIKETIKTFGGLNVLVNNAGYTWDGMVHKMTDAQFQAMLDIHVTAPFRIIRAATPYFRLELKPGELAPLRSIVNVTSVAGLAGNVGQANYAAAKAGIVGLTKTIAKEWGRFGVRCNAVAFGYIQTRLTSAKSPDNVVKRGDKEIPLGVPDQMRDLIVQMIPLGRGGLPEEAAQAILYLGSPISSYVSGHVLEVTGGMTF
jgi:3-oxoacyl-[acyl-carrier protein] reductase